MYSVIACKDDFTFGISIFTSQDLNACVSVATTCFSSSKLACFKIVDEKDFTLISYMRNFE